MQNDDHLEKTKAYYDEFAECYEDQRDGNVSGGYHDMIDDLEVEFVERYGRGGDVLEVGCGTGLLLRRFAGFAKRAVGVDLSPGMLARARARGLEVQEASATSLPFPDDSFDVACSFKVLAHVREIHQALAEMTRVVRPGGHVIAELYNPLSLRGLVKHIGPAGAISQDKDESAVYTRFDTPWSIGELKPRNTRFVGSRGVRIVTPAAAALRVPVLRWVIRKAERALCDTPLNYFGGFWIAALEKQR